MASTAVPRLAQWSSGPLRRTVSAPSSGFGGDFVPDRRLERDMRTREDNESDAVPGSGISPGKGSARTRSGISSKPDTPVLRTVEVYTEGTRRTMMFRDQMVNFLGATVLFLLMTNALSVAAATYAIRMMRALVPGGREAGGAVERKIDAILRRAA